MLKHVLHVFIGETQVQKGHGTLYLLLDLVLIEGLGIAIQVFNADLGEIDGWLGRLLSSLGHLLRRFKIISLNLMGS